MSQTVFKLVCNAWVEAEVETEAKASVFLSTFVVRAATSAAVLVAFVSVAEQREDSHLELSNRLASSTRWLTAVLCKVDIKTLPAA